MSILDKKDQITRRFKKEILEELVKVPRKDAINAFADKAAALMYNTLNVISTIHELKDPYTFGHQLRVANLACKVAQKMGISEVDDECIKIFVASHLHDIGKIAIPTELLVKPGYLTDEEFALIKTHPYYSWQIVKDMDLPWDVGTPILQHHERWNGSGYPKGLVGEEICIEARIIMVADVVEAMSSYRPYRPPVGIFQALEEIKANKGILYCPVCSDALIEVFEKDGFKFD